MSEIELSKFRVRVTAVTISSADVYVEAISSDDAHQIAATSCKPDDFEVMKVIEVTATESEMLEDQ